MTMKNFFALVLLLTFLNIPQIFCQAQPNEFKDAAKRQMLVGRYGEAIDLLNRYVSAYPQVADGYNLRGVCYEKRGQYEMAVYDFRSARKLQPDNSEINKNLAETTDTWYKLLYNKIEGHKREIAIYPKTPINYLEIGKSYKNLGDWLMAEDWYDKYLPMEEASPDEIIRYTEILAKNNHIQKGEPILKRYTEKFPTDQRLWSRYGYFELWLGKRKNAIDAFEKALAIKPYFKEAMSGLDQAKGNGYIFTFNDTSYRYNKILRGTKPQEYAIDKYYRMLKKNPEDYDLRFTLIDSLIKHKRFEEAHAQLQIMQPDEKIANTERFKNNLDYVSRIQDSTFKDNIKIYAGEFEKNNNNRDAAVKLSESYAHLVDYDNAVDVLEKYLATVKESEDLDLRFILTKYSAFGYKWNIAFNQMGILMKYSSDNKDYKLFYARLVAWNVITATPDELERAKGILLDILKDDPKNFGALITISVIDASNGEIAEAEKYLNMAKIINPDSKEVEAAGTHIYNSIQVQNSREIMAMRLEAGKLHDSGQFEAAADKYDSIMARIDNPDKNILLEYAATNTDAKRYELANKTYDKVLELGPDFDASSMKARNYYAAGDTVKALEEFKVLKIQNPYDFAVNYYLGDIYERTKKNDEAINLYESLIAAEGKSDVTLDSSQIAGFQTRLRYLKAGRNFKVSLLGYISLAPFASFYSDNLNFTLSNYGMRMETGLATFLSVGVSFSRYNFSYLADQKNLTSFLGYINFNANNFNASVGMGQTISISTVQKNVLQISMRYEKKNNFGLGLSYERNDARVLLYSPFLFSENINAGILKITGNYFLSPTVLLSGSYNYVNVSADNNTGYDLHLRVGKSWNDNINIGYEFNEMNYSKIDTLYYSPQNFQSHSIWADWNFYKDQKISLKIGGKLGYVPSNDFILREIFGEAVYQPFQILTISARISNSRTYQFYSGYSSWSGYIYCYLSIF